MRRSLLLFAIILIGGGMLSAQTISSEALYQKYRGEEGVVSIWLPGIAMKLAAGIADLDAEEDALLRSIRSLRVLTIEESDLYPEVNFAEEVKFKENGKYKLLLQVSDGKEDVLICAKMKKNKLRDILIVVGGDENVMVHIKGRINSDMIQSIADIADLDGMDNIDFLSQR